MEQDLLQLDGRIVVVAGAGGGGLGTTVTRMAARAGATVIGVSRNQANLDRHLGPLVADGLAVIPVAADVETAEGVDAVMDRVRGAEEVLVFLNPVFDALIVELYRYGGTVIGFAGDSITCWLDGDDGRRAIACGLVGPDAIF